MKKIVTGVLISFLCFSMFTVFAPNIKVAHGSGNAILKDFLQLTTNPYDDRGAGWSPDGSKIAYSAFSDSWYRNIWVMDSDGTNKQQLTFGNVVDDSPSCSPDGTKIVFMRYGLRGIDGSDLMVMNADGTNIQQLTSTGLHRGQPRWSHDGKRLAFYYGGAGTAVNEIHIMDADGTNEVTVASGTYTVMNPGWSPDDTKLVYTMDDGIWLVDTSPPYQKTRLFQTSLPTMYAEYSPDGKYIIYASGPYGTPAPYGQNLYLIDSSGNFIAQLTNDNNFGYQFDWSPDGQYIAYDSISSGNWDVWRTTIVPDTGLIGYWKFDEGSGTIAADSSGNGNTGTVVGAQWVDGISDKALQFDGVDDYVHVPNSPSLDISGNQISVEYWVNFPRGWYPGISIGGDWTHGHIVYDKGDAYTAAFFDDTGTHVFAIPYVPPYPVTNKNTWDANVWYHIADVFDGSSIKMYINGALDKAETVIGSVSRSSLDLAIGSHCFGDIRFFEGIIDEFAIYNYARTAEEVLSDYNSLKVSLPWKDDFNYNTKDEMKAAGWTLDEEVRISVGGGLLTLDNDGTAGCGVNYMGHFPLGTNDFRVETKSNWIGRQYGSRVVYVWTSRHRYGWFADGYYPEYAFIRYSNGWDGSDDKVLRFGGYAPVMNEWTTMALEKRGNTFYMYQDGQLKNKYVEADSAPDQLVGVSMSGCWLSTMQYDYISVERTRARFSPTTDGYQFSNTETTKQSVTFRDALKAVSSASWSSSIPIQDWPLCALWSLVVDHFQQGNCFGMSYTAKYYYEDPSAFAMDYPGYAKMYAVGLATASPEIIANQFPGQEYIQPYLFNMMVAYLGLKSLNSDVQWIMNRIDENYVAQLYLLNPLWKLGNPLSFHSVLVYNYEPVGNGVKLKIYDPNAPIGVGVPLYITLTKDLNGNFAIVKEGTYDDIWTYYPDLTNICAGEFPSIDWGIVSSHLAELTKFIWDAVKLLGVSFFGLEVESPVNILVTDPLGSRVGYNASSQSIINEIEGSFYSGNGTEPQIVLIPDPKSGTYSIALAGTATGNYVLNIEYINSTGTLTKSFNGATSSQQTSCYSVLLSQTGQMTAISWACVFQDIKRGTTLKISTDDKYFQFTAPGKDFGVKQDPRMMVLKNVIGICYDDSRMRLIATAVVGRIDFCSAIAWDEQTGRTYLLIAQPTRPTLCRVNEFPFEPFC